MRTSKRLQATGLGLVAMALLLVAGCGITGPRQGEGTAKVARDERKAEVEIADRYWAYAALAAEVYATKGKSRHMLVLPLSSSVLRRELEKSEATTVAKGPSAIGQEIFEMAQAAYGVWQLDDDVRKRCLHAATPEACQAILDTGSIAKAEINTADAVLPDPADIVKVAQAESQEKDFEDEEARTFEQCNVTDSNKRPKVPLHLVTDKARPGHWAPVDEFSKYADVRGWNFFVPELAIDVWVRERPDRSDRSYEYALVYRGTAGPGGWFSNFQIVAAITPLFWDQYNQAKHATRNILKQIAYVHKLIHERTGRKSDVLVTTVGHSLGGGLAQYMYYSFTQITKVVGFNSSPVDGSRLLLGPKAREKNEKAERPLDRSSLGPDASPAARIFLLTEDGEILGRVGGCTSGPTWGSEGGPVKECEAVDLTTGSWFRQHDMRQFACKLAHLHANQGRRHAQQLTLNAR